MNETILVTGACGFTGSTLLEYLVNQYPSATVVATDLDESRRNEYYFDAAAEDDPQPVYFEDILERLDVEFIPADLTDETAVDALRDGHEYDRIFHVASLFDYFASREVLYDVNVDGTRNLLSALSSGDGTSRLIHWSTLGVLGDAGFDSPKTEAADYNPHNRYCESKVDQERVVESFAGEFDTTIIRPAPIYGPRHRYGVYHLVTLSSRLGFVPVPKLLPRRRQLQFPSVHVHDVVRAAEFLSRTPETIGETYNVLSDTIGQDEMLAFLARELSLPTATLPVPYPVYSLMATGADVIARYLEVQARRNGTRQLIDAPMLKYLTANMWFSNQKLKATGFDLTYQDPRHGLRDYLDWCRAQGLVDRRIDEPEPRIGGSILRRVVP